MRRGFIVACVALASLAWSVLPVSAATTSGHQHQVHWKKRDTAIYVVSTVNLLRDDGGKLLAPSLKSELQINRFAVYADTLQTDLYFIVLRHGPDVVGALAYKMGWPQPMSVSAATDQIGARKALPAIVQAYSSDPKSLMGTFKSTLPSS